MRKNDSFGLVLCSTIETTELLSLALVALNLSEGPSTPEEEEMKRSSSTRSDLQN